MKGNVKRSFQNTMDSLELTFLANEVEREVTQSENTKFDAKSFGDLAIGNDLRMSLTPKLIRNRTL